MDAAGDTQSRSTASRPPTSACAPSPPEWGVIRCLRGYGPGIQLRPSAGPQLTGYRRFNTGGGALRRSPHHPEEERPGGLSLTVRVQDRQSLAHPLSIHRAYPRARDPTAPAATTIRADRMPNSTSPASAILGRSASTCACKAPQMGGDPMRSGVGIAIARPRSVTVPNSPASAAHPSQPTSRVRCAGRAAGFPSQLRRPSRWLRWTASARLRTPSLR